MAEAQVKLGYLLSPTFQIENTNGKPIVGGYIEVYYAGTNEKYITYQNFDYTQNPFKIPLGSDGRAVVLADADFAYDVYVRDSYGNLVFSRMNVAPGNAGGVAGGGLREVSHDETLTGKGTVLSPLGVSPLTNLAVDDTMTAYEATVAGRDALVLGVNSDWFDETFSGAWSGKVDYDEFSACCSAVNSSLANKVDYDYLFENYYNKTDTHNIFLPRSAYTNSGDYYTKSETYNKLEIENFINGKQDTLTFGYDENSNISSINNSALWGGGSSSGGDIWITGAKVIAPDTIDLLPGVTAQSLSSFTVSGDKNHCIAVKGGIYRVPDINQWVSAISSTNYFTTQNEFYSSAYMLSGAIDYVSAHAGDEFPASANDAITAYQTYSGDYLTAHQDLSAYYTTADANTMSSMFSGAIDYVSANAGGGSNLVSPKNTLIVNANSAEASISGVYPEHNEHTISSFSSNTYTIISDLNTYYNFTSATSVKFDIKNNNQWVSALMGYKVYENDTLVSSGNNVTAINITTSYAEPTDFELLIEPASMTQVSFYASADYYKVIPEQIVNLYDVPPYTQSAIDYKSQIGYINDYISANPAKNANLLISGHNGIDGNKLIFSYEKNGAITSENVGYIVPSSPKTGTQVLTNNYNGSNIWQNSTDLIKNSTPITYLSGAIDYLSGCEDNTSGGVDYISAAIDFVSANYVDRTYTGVAPIQVNNSTKEIGITGESLSAGPGVDIFSSGGYVVISGDGLVDRFPMSSNTYNCNYTLDVKSSAIYISTATGAAGATTTFNVRGVRYDAFPSTYVSASWYDIINAGNNKCNVYCVQFSNVMTAIDLANYSAYDKITVVHSNDYTPNCHLYWKSYTKVCPSGFWCDLVKGKDEQSNTEWYFTNSGWMNNYEWDWD